MKKQTKRERSKQLGYGDEQGVRIVPPAKKTTTKQRKGVKNMASKPEQLTLFEATAKFRALRIEKGITQADIESKVGVAHLCYRIETRKERLEKKRAEQVAKALGLTLDKAVAQKVFRKRSA